LRLHSLYKQKNPVATGSYYYSTETAAGKLLCVTLIELIDTTSGINKFLTSGKEGVALGANTNFEFGTGTLDVPDFAAGASNSGITIFGMDVFFHFL
jgi:hypothetical protein